MREEVYDYLREYGFSVEELNYFEKENEKMFFTNLIEVNKNIDFLTSKGLIKEEIIYVFKNNPFMITVKNNRLEMLDKIYLEDLQFDKELLKKLIISNPDVYTVSPIELQKNIDYLKEHNCSIETIKKFIIDNPQVISVDNTDLIAAVKFN